MKFCIFVSCCAALTFYSVAVPRNVDLDGIAVGSYSFYSTDEITSPYITRVTDLGFSYIYECKSTDADKVRPLFSRIDGESITVDKGISTKKILKTLGARVVANSDFGTYAYTPRNQTYIMQNNHKINVQIFHGEDTTTVGFPVILGSY